MEICIDSVASAINAEKAGASRVELCGNLVEGGTTPSLGVFQMIKEKTSIPVFVMIRPRGGDFLYTDVEFEVMAKEIDIFKQQNADGFVFGILKRDGTIDMERNQTLIDSCKPKPATFHRAFDVTADGDEALEQIIKLGFQRILTSGMEPTVLEGLPYLEELIKKAGDRVIIVPGGGINEKNLARIIDGCHCQEFHCSARSSEVSSMVHRRTDVHMGSGLYPTEYTIKTSDISRIENMLETARILQSC